MTIKPCTWRIAGLDRPKTRALADAAGLPPLMAHLLLLRGIQELESVRHFLAPSMAQLSDPALLTGITAAAERLRVARDRGERVCIFGDYDVDGIAGMAVLINAFRRFGISNFSYAIPQRHIDGYGLNAAQVRAAAQDGVRLMVTVDNGISAHDAAQSARACGVDLIITDHHALDGILPDALAVVNPKRESPDHPAGNLCGAAVAFKLAVALNKTPNDLDLVALGTIADVMPLLGENRAITSLGLRHMAMHRRPGLAKLAQVAGVDLQTITSEQVGFQLSPRLNAAGRLDDAMIALRLLLSMEEGEAWVLAQQLEAANTERRAIERQIFEEASEEADAWLGPDRRGVVLARRGWHIGVIGIVAARLQTRYNRPVVLIAIDENGNGRGSARSGPGFSMIQAFSACHHLLDRFGGHQSAAGLSIREDRILDFREAFEQEAQRQLGEREPANELFIEALAAFSELDGALLRALQRLEPAGQGNPAPVFCSMGVELAPQSMRLLKDRHLKMTLLQGGTAFPAIGFNMAEKYYTEDLPHWMDVAYTPQLNTWRGETTPQLLIKDIRPAQ